MRKLRILLFDTIVICYGILNCSSLSLFASIPLAVTGSIVLTEIYTKIPQSWLFRSTPPSLPNFDQDNVFIIFPGAGGPDKNTDDIVQAGNKSLGVNNFFISCYDWKQWRGNFLRAAFDSEIVGKMIGSQLASINLRREPSKQFKIIHAVGISVGSFAANACIQEYKNKMIKSSLKDNSYCRLTLLDPFTSRGLYDSKYGENYFGKTADYCEQYLNTDDEVPFTNKPLPNAYCYDVTSCQERNSFTPLPGDSMHSWPGQ
jgi:hypothetical protein